MTYGDLATLYTTQCARHGCTPNASTLRELGAGATAPVISPSGRTVTVPRNAFLGSKGLAAFLDFVLVAAPHVCALNAALVGAPDGLAALLAERFTGHATLSELDLTHNGLDDACVPALLRLISNSPRLRRVDLFAGNAISASSLERIGNALKRNDEGENDLLVNSNSGLAGKAGPAAGIVVQRTWAVTADESGGSPDFPMTWRRNGQLRLMVVPTAASEQTDLPRICRVRLAVTVTRPCPTCLVGLVAFRATSTGTHVLDVTPGALGPATGAIVAESATYDEAGGTAVEVALEVGAPYAVMPCAFRPGGAFHGVVEAALLAASSGLELIFEQMPPAALWRTSRINGSWVPGTTDGGDPRHSAAWRCNDAVHVCVEAALPRCSAASTACPTPYVVTLTCASSSHSGDDPVVGFDIFTADCGRPMAHRAPLASARGVSATAVLSFDIPRTVEPRGNNFFVVPYRDHVRNGGATSAEVPYSVEIFSPVAAALGMAPLVAAPRCVVAMPAPCVWAPNPGATPTVAGHTAVSQSGTLREMARREGGDTGYCDGPLGEVDPATPCYTIAALKGTAAEESAPAASTVTVVMTATDVGGAAGGDVESIFSPCGSACGARGHVPPVMPVRPVAMELRVFRVTDSKVGPLAELVAEATSCATPHEACVAFAMPTHGGTAQDSGRYILVPTIRNRGVPTMYRLVAMSAAFPITVSGFAGHTATVAEWVQAERVRRGGDAIPVSTAVAATNPVSTAAGCQTPYTDRDFPPGPSSLWKTADTPPKLMHRGGGLPDIPEVSAVWQRAERLFPQMVLAPVTHAADVAFIPGAVDSAWCLSAVAALVAARPSFVPHLVPSIQLERGCFTFRFYERGARPTDVTVDGYLPVDAMDDLVFARGGNPSDAFFPLIEKALAKYFRCYAALDDAGTRPADGVPSRRVCPRSGWSGSTRLVSRSAAAAAAAATPAPAAVEGHVDDSDVTIEQRLWEQGGCRLRDGALSQTSQMLELLTGMPCAETPLEAADDSDRAALWDAIVVGLADPARVLAVRACTATRPRASERCTGSGLHLDVLYPILQSKVVVVEPSDAGADASAPTTRVVHLLKLHCPCPWGPGAIQGGGLNRRRYNRHRAAAVSAGAGSNPPGLSAVDSALASVSADAVGGRSFWVTLDELTFYFSVLHAATLPAAVADMDATSVDGSLAVPSGPPGTAPAVENAQYALTIARPAGASGALTPLVALQLVQTDARKELGYDDDAFLDYGRRPPLQLLAYRVSEHRRLDVPPHSPAAFALQPWVLQGPLGATDATFGRDVLLRLPAPEDATVEERYIVMPCYAVPLPRECRPCPPPVDYTLRVRGIGLATAKLPSGITATIAPVQADVATLCRLAPEASDATCTATSAAFGLVSWYQVAVLPSQSGVVTLRLRDAPCASMGALRLALYDPATGCGIRREEAPDPARLVASSSAGELAVRLYGARVRHGRPYLALVEGLSLRSGVPLVLEATAAARVGLRALGDSEHEWRYRTHDVALQGRDSVVLLEVNLAAVPATGASLYASVAPRDAARAPVAANAPVADFRPVRPPGPPAPDAPRSSYSRPPSSVPRGAGTERGTCELALLQPAPLGAPNTQPTEVAVSSAATGNCVRVADLGALGVSVRGARLLLRVRGRLLPSAGAVFTVSLRCAVDFTLRVV